MLSLYIVIIAAKRYLSHIYMYFFLTKYISLRFTGEEVCAKLKLVNLCHTRVSRMSKLKILFGLNIGIRSCYLQISVFFYCSDKYALLRSIRYR